MGWESLGPRNRCEGPSPLLIMEGPEGLGGGHSSIFSSVISQAASLLFDAIATVPQTSGVDGGRWTLTQRPGQAEAG